MRILEGLVHIVLKSLCLLGHKLNSVAGKIFDIFDIFPTPFLFKCLVLSHVASNRLWPMATFITRWVVLWKLSIRFGVTRIGGIH